MPNFLGLFRMPKNYRNPFIFDGVIQQIEGGIFEAQFRFPLL